MEVPSPPLKKVKLFIYGEILLKFETEQFHMCTNNNRDNNLNMRVPPPSLPIKKVKLFIYGAILLKFETQHFLMFTNTKLCENLKLSFSFLSIQHCAHLS